MGQFQAEVQRYKDQLRAMIVRAELAEGAVLNEDALRREAGESVRVVRHALIELAREGLLVRRPRVGTIVAGTVAGRAAPKLRSVAVLSSLKQSALTQRSFLARVVHGIRAELTPPKQIHLYMRAEDEIVGGVDDPPRVEAAQLRGHTQGVIAVEANHAPALNELVAASLPVVAVDFAPRGAAFDAVCVDHIHAGYLATEHLLRLGHRRIAFAGELPVAASTDPTWQDRLTGYLRAMAEAGDLNAAPSLFGIRYRSMKYIAAELPGFHHTRQPTAYVLCASNSADLLIATLQRLGLRCPQDVSIACADGMVVETTQGLKLSRIRVDYEDLGENAVRLLEARLAHKHHPPVIAPLPVQFEAGESSRALN